jgi:hypothetical protein
MTISCVRTSIQSPWQNGVAERWVGSCRRDLLDHIIALNERHLKRLLADYIRYYPRRPHSPGLEKSKHPAAEFVQQIGVAWFLRRGSVACINVTIRPCKTTSPKTDLRRSSSSGLRFAPESLATSPQSGNVSPRSILIFRLKRFANLHLPWCDLHCGEAHPSSSRGGIAKVPHH